jgi:hypothetical protein
MRWVRSEAIPLSVLAGAYAAKHGVSEKQATAKLKALLVTDAQLALERKPGPDPTFAPELIAQMLRERLGLELELIDGHGVGPDDWTLENAAHALGAQLRWSESGIATLLGQMVAAASDAQLVVRHPHTGLPVSGEPHSYYELVTTAEINRWLASSGAAYALGKSLPSSPTPRHTAQEEAILAVIRKLELDPMALKYSDKKRVRAELPYPKAVFDHAWKRLQKAGRIGLKKPRKRRS